MTDPTELYRIDQAVAEQLTGTRPVLLNLLEGFIDAGQVMRTTTATVLEQYDHEQLAVFDHDLFHDYRSRRPTMTFDTGAFTEVTDIAVVLHKVLDPHGEVFLLLEGPEPDTRWELVLAAVQELIARFDVRLTVSLHGVPMAVPHTRPITMTAHGTDPALTTGQRNWLDRVEVPASFSALLEYRLGRADRAAHGFAVHVPHYLTQAMFPPAVIAGMEAVESVTGLKLPVEALTEALTATMTEISGETSQSDEIQRVVGELEAQYDAFMANAERELPSAEELGAEFERFLRDQGPTQGPGDPDGPRGPSAP